MSENVAEFPNEIKDLNKIKKPQIFCVTPEIKRKRFVLGEDTGTNENLDEQGCYPDCSPCSPCQPCSPVEWKRDDCYPDCNPCNPCSPCNPGEWEKDDCYPDCNPCSPCQPCRPDER